MADTERYDIVIAGAGLTGAAFALAAAQAQLKVVMVDPQPFSDQLAPTFDGRSTAVAFCLKKLHRVKYAALIGNNAR